jgi:hypothetical protein
MIWRDESSTEAEGDDKSQMWRWKDSSDTDALFQRQLLPSQSTTEFDELALQNYLFALLTTGVRITKRTNEGQLLCMQVGTGTTTLQCCLITRLREGSATILWFWKPGKTEWNAEYGK